MLPLAAFLSEEQFLSWGWRIPFFLSALMVLVGYIVRRTLEETPAFAEESSHDEVPAAPLKVLFRDYKKPLFQVFCASLIASIGSVFTVFGLSYATGAAYGIGMSPTLMLWVAILANVVATVIIPVYAALSDRIGRKPIFLFGTVSSAVAIALFLWSISTGDGTLIMVTGVLVGGFVASLTNAVWPATYAERFPTSVRLSGMAIGTQFASPSPVSARSPRPHWPVSAAPRSGCCPPSMPWSSA